MQMWMPILKHEDGYGFTYGARLAFKDSLGDRSRLSVPMSWGGERRIGLEAERSFDGPISIVRGGVSLYRRVNPFFEVPDRRTEARVEADKLFTSWLRAGVDARVANVQFGPDYDHRHSAAGVHTVVDTRIDRGIDGRLADGVVESVDVEGAAVPDGTVAVVGNLTLTAPTSGGYSTVASFLTGNPTTSSINVRTGDTLANGVTFRLAGDGSAKVVFQGTSGSSTHAIIDIVGYFR